MRMSDRPEMPDIKTVPDELKMYVLGIESYVSFLEGYIDGLCEYIKEMKNEYALLP